MKKFAYSFFFIFAGCFASEVPAEQNHQHVITDLQEFANAWAHAAVSDLSREELEFLGAFLYFNASSSLYELVLRNALLDLQRGSQILAFKVINQDETEQSINFYSKLQSTLEYIEKNLVPSRNYFFSCWNQCSKEIEQSSYEKLKIAIEQLKLLGQRSLNNWAKTNLDEIKQILEKNSNSLDDALRKINMCKKAVDELVEGTFPLSQETEFVEIQTIHNTLGISHVLYEALFHASLATDEMMGVSFGLMNLNTILFGTLYQSFYKALEEKSMLPMYFIINEQGLLPLETRTQVLPEFSFNAITIG